MSDLTDLPDELVGLVQNFASPADIYNLHFTSKALFRETNQKDKEGSALNKQKFTRLMQYALASSMESTLGKNRASVNRNVDTFKSFVKLANSLPPDSVAMSGSIVVQAVLGEQWDGSDIDVYCTHLAAPSVRTWLIHDMKQVLVGIHMRYRESHEKGLRPNKNLVDHVEHWANAPEENKKFEHECGETWRFNSNDCLHQGPL